MGIDLEPPLPRGDRGVQQTASRSRWRREIAEALELDVTALHDGARLMEDLALDSLARMTLLTWLETKGVTATPAGLHRIGDVLTLLDRMPVRDGVSVRLVSAGGDDSATHLPAAEPRPSPLAPVMHNGAYQLTPVGDGDLNFLYLLASHPETSYRWRYRGIPPQPERFAAELWGDVLVQFAVRTVNGGEPAGLVVAYAGDLAHGHAYLAAVFLPEHAGTGLAADAVGLFVRYLFHSLPLRKLYLEVPGYNWPQLRSAAGRLFQVEGVLRDHDFYAGRYWHKYLCAVYPPGRQEGAADTETPEFTVARTTEREDNPNPTDTGMDEKTERKWR